MHVNLYKCQILNKVKLLLGNTKRNSWRFNCTFLKRIIYIHMHRNNATYHINSKRQTLLSVAGVCFTVGEVCPRGHHFPPLIESKPKLFFIIAFICTS